MLAVHRGLREPRGWRWPAAFALVTASGGGVNGAVTALDAARPGAAGALRAWVRARSAGGVVAAFLLRARAADGAAVAVVDRARLRPVEYGMSFLHFTEQPGADLGHDQR